VGSQVLSERTPDQFNGVAVWGFWWSIPPFFLKEIFNYFAGMLRIIIMVVP